MVGELFLLDELFAYIVFIVGKWGVVVIVYALVSIGAWTLKDAGSWYPFGANSVTEVDVNRWVAFGGGHVAQVFEGGESAVPVTVCCGVLASEPSD